MLILSLHFAHSTEILCAKLELEARINGKFKRELSHSSPMHVCFNRPNLVCMRLFIAEARACTGSSAVHPRSRDIKISNFSITFFGSEMLQDTTLELNCGRRYGIIGLNGCGKSSLLAVLGNREVSQISCIFIPSP